ncbi:hypothetical protein ACFL0Q_06275 [Thermodesulfobacteriota bacterium]
MDKKAVPLEARVTQESTGYRIPGDLLTDIPIVMWKLLETHERRLRSGRQPLLS